MEGDALVICEVPNIAISTLRPAHYQRGIWQQVMDDLVKHDVSTEPFRIQSSPTSRAVAPVHFARRQPSHQHVSTLLHRPPPSFDMHIDHADP
jgi:hypothetical protein